MRVLSYTFELNHLHTTGCHASRPIQDLPQLTVRVRVSIRVDSEIDVSGEIEDIIARNK